VNTLLTVYCGASLLHHADCFRIVDTNAQIAQDVERRSMDSLAVSGCQ
jgi:hypothetical protein